MFDRHGELGEALVERQFPPFQPLGSVPDRHPVPGHPEKVLSLGPVLCAPLVGIPERFLELALIVPIGQQFILDPIQLERTWLDPGLCQGQPGLRLPPVWGRIYVKALLDIERPQSSLPCFERQCYGTAVLWVVPILPVVESPISPLELDDRDLR